MFRGQTLHTLWAPPASIQKRIISEMFDSYDYCTKKSGSLRKLYQVIGLVSYVLVWKPNMKFKKKSISITQKTVSSDPITFI